MSEDSSKKEPTPSEEKDIIEEVKGVVLKVLDLTDPRNR